MYVNACYVNAREHKGAVNAHVLVFENVSATVNVYVNVAANVGAHAHANVDACKCMDMHAKSSCTNSYTRLHLELHELELALTDIHTRILSQTFKFTYITCMYMHIGINYTHIHIHTSISMYIAYITHIRIDIHLHEIT